MSRVYFAQAGRFRGGGMIKIGFTKNLQQRLRELQVGCPHDLTLIACPEFGEYAHVVEGRLHRAFAVLRRIGSEWFESHPIIFETASRLNRFRFDPMKWWLVDEIELPVLSVDDFVAWQLKTPNAEEHW